MNLKKNYYCLRRPTFLKKSRQKTSIRSWLILCCFNYLAFVFCRCYFLNYKKLLEVQKPFLEKVFGRRRHYLIFNKGEHIICRL
jgi:hypothetical protein